MDIVSVLQNVVLTVLSAVFMVMMLIVVIALYAALLALPGALLLRMACSLLGEPNVVYRRALAISGKAFAAQMVLILGFGVLSSAVNSTFFPYLGVLLSLVCLWTAAKIYSRMLPVRFARAVVVALTQFLILSLGAVFALVYAELSGYLEPLFFQLSWIDLGQA